MIETRRIAARGVSVGEAEAGAGVSATGAGVAAPDALDPLDVARVTTTAAPPTTTNAARPPQSARDARVDGRVCDIVCVFAVSGPAGTPGEPVERTVSLESTPVWLGCDGSSGSTAGRSDSAAPNSGGRNVVKRESTALTSRRS